MRWHVQAVQHSVVNLALEDVPIIARADATVDVQETAQTVVLEIAKEAALSVAKEVATEVAVQNVLVLAMTVAPMHVEMIVIAIVATDAIIHVPRIAV